MAQTGQLVDSLPQVLCDGFPLDRLERSFAHRRGRCAHRSRLLWLGWASTDSELARLSKVLMLRVIVRCFPSAPTDWDVFLIAQSARSLKCSDTAAEAVQCGLVDTPLLHHSVKLRPAPGAFSLLWALSAPWPDGRVLELAGPAVCGVVAGWRLDVEWSGRQLAIAMVSEAVGSGLSFPHCYTELFEHMAGTAEGRRALAAGDGLTVVQGMAQLCLHGTATVAVRVLCKLLQDESEAVKSQLCCKKAATVLATMLRQLGDLDTHSLRWLSEALSASIGPSPRQPNQTWQVLRSEVVTDGELYSWLMEMVATDDHPIRHLAAKALATLCAHLGSPEVVRVLALFNDDQESVQWAVAETIAVLSHREEMHRTLLEPATATPMAAAKVLSAATLWGGVMGLWSPSKSKPPKRAIGKAANHWPGVDAIAALHQYTRCHEPVLYAMTELTRNPDHHSVLASAGLIRLCGLLAQRPHGEPQSQLRILKSLAEFSKSPEHRTQVLSALDGVGCVLVEGGCKMRMCQMRLLELAADLMTAARNRLVGNLSSLRETLHFEVRPIATWAFACEDTELQMAALRCVATMGPPLYWCNELDFAHLQPPRTALGWVRRVWMAACIHRTQHNPAKMKCFSWRARSQLTLNAENARKNCSLSVASTLLVEHYDLESPGGARTDLFVQTPRDVADEKAHAMAIRIEQEERAEAASDTRIDSVSYPPIEDP